jgi:hypothetical protein
MVRLGVGVGIEIRDEWPPGNRHVAGLAYEPTVLGRGNGMLVHPKAFDLDAMVGPLLRVEVFGAHEELAARYPRHLPRGRQPW